MIELITEIIDLMIQEFLPDGKINLNWRHFTWFWMLYFALLGWKKGWQRSLVTLISLFFAWGIALRTSDFFVGAIDYSFRSDFSGEMMGFFKILLYLASVVMVVVTINRIVSAKVEKPEKISGFLTGLLNGYLFVLLLLNLGSEWLDNHIGVWGRGPSLYLNLPGHLPNVSTYFTNNPSETYMELMDWQNVLLLFLFLIFLRTFIFEIFGWIEDRLRGAKKG